MNYKNSKRIRNRWVGEAEVELLYGVFSKFCDDGNTGRVCVTVKGVEFVEFSPTLHVRTRFQLSPKE